MSAIEFDPECAAGREIYRLSQSSGLGCPQTLEETKSGPSISADLVRAGVVELRALGAEGVGLYRTEVPFLLRERFPSEEEQRQIYRNQLEAFAPRPVTMRTLDIGVPQFGMHSCRELAGSRDACDLLRVLRRFFDHPGPLSAT